MNSVTCHVTNKKFDSIMKIKNKQEKKVRERERLFQNLKK